AWIITIGCSAEECRTATRENPARLEEMIVCIAYRLTAEEFRRTKGSEEPVRAAQSSKNPGRPGEAAMPRHNWIDLPTAEQPALPVALTSKQGELPQGAFNKVVCNIEIRRTTFLFLVDREALVCATTWGFPRSIIDT